jgi:hypothetical protein
MSAAPGRTPAVLRKNQGTDLYGQPKLGVALRELVAVVKLEFTSQHTTVRADSSASRGFADEFVTQNRFLLARTTKVAIDDQLTVAGVAVRIKTLTPRYDVWGELDHYEARGEVWA